MSAEVSVKPVSAVVFCQFPENLSAGLRKHLEEWGINLKYFGEISTSTEMRDPGCDLVICFHEMMSHNQTDHAKYLAKRWDARFLTLSRKVSSWTKTLPVPRPMRLVTSPPESSRVSRTTLPDGETSWTESSWEDLKDLFAEEAEKLKLELAESQAEKERLKKAISESNGEVLNLAIEEAALYQTKIDDLDKRLQEREETITRLQFERDQLRASSLATIGGAVRTLVAAGILDEREAADRIFKLVMTQS